MSSYDIAEAMAYDRLDPCGEERADLRAGIICSIIANVNRGKNTEAFTPSDFMPDFSKSVEEIEEEKQNNWIEKIKKAFK